MSLGPWPAGNRGQAMVNRTKIEWCDYTANPIRYRRADDPTGQRGPVWACVKASEGCQNCYAESRAWRFQGRQFTASAMRGVVAYVDEGELRQILSPKRLPAGSKLFVGDMTDIFGEWVPFEFLDRLFAVFALRPDVTVQVLTKRPERMREYLTADTHELGERFDSYDGARQCSVYDPPLPNVWLGCSVENQQRADVRIPELLATPAAVRFLSCEPLLGPVDVAPYLSPFECCHACHEEYREVWSAPNEEWNRVVGGEGGLRCPQCYQDEAGSFGITPTVRLHGIVPERISWVIVGGESGPGARPCDVAWIRAIVSQCRAAAVAVFVKQLGGSPRMTLKDWEATHTNLRLRDRKGADPAEWPEDLRVREMPR